VICTLKKLRIKAIAYIMLEPTNQHKQVAAAQAMDALVEKVAECIGRRWKRYAIRSLIQQLWPSASPQQMEAVMSAGHKMLAARANLSTEELRGQSLSFYDSIIGDENASLGDRLRAQENIDRLMDLHRKTKATAAALPDAGKLLDQMKALNGG
jgi:hypothetical protein